MAVLFTLPWWVSGGKGKGSKISTAPSPNSSSEISSWESDTLKFPPPKRNAAAPSRNIKPKWRSREERKMDREYDVVLVPPDGGCISGSESDDSDWSVGWLEPHGPGFQSNDELDDSFAVLVPCYGRVRDDLVEDSRSKLLKLVGNITEIYPADAKDRVEEWLSLIA
ncbi:hypothetical protein SAY87_031022 [Trapa incisa]|uniref:Uncharacterized protein n=1 Tax=Trapa incisa TaxID=236973 RepID=A0AAN7KPE0_9MYRT|nr:hypothetical protein SAY87_031022 [Trapa incisa]